MTGNAPPRGRQVIDCPWCLTPVAVNGSAALGCPDALRHIQRCPVLHPAPAARGDQP